MAAIAAPLVNPAVAQTTREAEAAVMRVNTVEAAAQPVLGVEHLQARKVDPDLEADLLL